MRMLRTSTVLAGLCAALAGDLWSAPAWAQEKKPAEAAKPATAKPEAAKPEEKDGVPRISEGKPLKALLVTGGCCHDYERQKAILSKGISARANVQWTIVHQGGSTTDARIPLYEDPNWAEGYDVVVHNECFAGVKDKAWVDRILRPHREGLPAVLIHCAMHCYRTGDDQWFEFVGLQSPGHGANYPHVVENLKPDHPIMSQFGKEWLTNNGELYYSIKLWPTATPLGQSRRKDNNQPQTCIWTNLYNDKCRVFATTIGHHNETMAQPEYLDVVTRGLLWSVDKLDDKTFHKTDEKTNEAIRALCNAKPAAQAKADDALRCCGDGNFAMGKAAKASSEQTGNKNFIINAFDGDLRTRWCASGGKGGEWLQVDLGKPEHVRNVRTHWESAGTAYSYKIEGSADGENWKILADRSKNDKKEKVVLDECDAPDTRYVKVTFLKSSSGGWGSIWELEVYGGKAPPLPAGAQNDAGGQGGSATIADVEALPKGKFDVKMFGAPPKVNYPECLTAASTGEVFVGVDEQGSLGKEKGRGKILRCVDHDGDGQADEIKEFCKVDHPRGLVYDAGRLWVLHPPYLSVYVDENEDGVADSSKVLIDGISTDQVAARGADHTTNGIRMGIDGWIYIAVGDFGFTKAVGADGAVLSRRGGGIVRIRPDGSEMEVFAWGLRNVLDACIDPCLNVFTRDNTNDGGGWNVRFTHILQSAEYGYPSLYINFADEIMPTLADYGGGSGCGGMFFQDSRWPAPFGDAVYTCDWGRSEVLRHNPPAVGATFAPHQESFLKLPRPTDIDVDGSGRMYVSSWKNGGFSFSGVNVGFVAQVTPKDFTPKPFPNLRKLEDGALVAMLDGPSAVHRQHSQLEILRRGASPERSAAVRALASNATVSKFGRVAAIFTLAQLEGPACHAYLVQLAASDAVVREFALKALTDRKTMLSGLSVEPFVKALSDADPRVRAQALICLGRLGDKAAGSAILPLATRPSDAPRPTKEPVHAQPDPAGVIPHLAVRALAAIGAYDVCIAALEGPSAPGAAQALRWMHRPEAASGLIAKLSSTQDAALRKTILSILVRLYFREGAYSAGWWGTRPDTSGPYFDRKTWEASESIAAAIKSGIESGDKATKDFLNAELAKHKVQIAGLPTVVAAADVPEPTKAIVIEKADPKNPNLVANLPYEAAHERAVKTPGDAAKGMALFTQKQCVNCHTFASGQTPKGPHLVDIGKRYKRPELVESILKPSAKIAQGFDTYSFVTASGKTLTGFVVSESAETIKLRQIDGVAQEIPKDEIEDRVKQEQSMMPKGLVDGLTPEQVADLVAYLESLK